MAKYSYAVKNLLKMDGIDPEKIGKPAAGKAAPIDPARSAEQRSDIQAQKDAEEFSKVDESALKIRSIQAMKDQEEFAEGADVPSVSKIRADAAKKQLQRYQEQYDQKTKARAEKQKKDQFYSDLITGNPDIIIPADAPDEEEKRLKAQLDRAQREADYWDGQLKQEQEAATRRADMAEVENWDEADREELERYIRNRQSAFVQSLNPALTGLPAQYEDSYLIEKYGRERLDEIARSYQREQNAAKYEQAAQEGRDMAKGGLAKNIGGNLLSVGANLADTLLDPLTRIAQGAGGKDDRYSTLDPYAGGQARAYASGVREQTVENIEGEDPTAARKGLSYLYQGGMAAADSLARATVGGSGTVGAGLAALGSFNQTLSQASAQGASPEQAYTLATINSGIEAATEKMPLDELFKVAKGGAKPAAQVVWNILKSAGIEAATEEISLVGTILAEAAILQEKSGYNQQVMMDVLSGKSLEQAKQDANRALLAEAIHTAIVSGISGGISAGGAEIKAGRNGGVQGAQTAQAGQETETAVGNEQQAGMARDQEDSTAVNTDPGQHTPREQAIIDDYQNSVDDNLVEYVETIKSNPGQKMPRYPLKDVSDRAASDIQRLTGIDVSGNKTQIEARAVEHILKRHGENGNADHSMRDVNDIGRIQHVIDNYDSMEHGGTTAAYRYQDADGKQVHAQTVLIKKKVNGTYFVVEAVPDTKKKTLYVLSAYMNKNGQKETASSLVGDAEAYRVTSETKAKSDTVLNNSIPQNSTEVNGKLDSAQQTDTQNSMQTGASNSEEQSAEGGQVIGVGAAEHNFSGKSAYQQLLRDDNVQPDRVGDVRPMEVPKTDTKGKRVTEFAANAYGAGVTTDEMASTIESLIQDGELGFDVRTNQESLGNAAATIQAKGAANVRNQITRNISKGKIRDGDVEQAILLYARYAEKGDNDNASEMLVDLAQMANMTGRNLQLFKLLRRMTVEGQVMTLQKEIRRSTESLVKSGQVKKGYEPSFDPDMVENYRKALEELRVAKNPREQEAARQKAKEIQDAVYAAEAAKMPATFKAKWDAWRYMAMLGNAKTQVRNIAGNLMFEPYKITKDKMAALFEKALPREQRTKALVQDKGLLDWARADARSEDVHNALKYSARIGDDVAGQKIAEQRKIFDTKALEGVRKFVEKVPQAGDMLFKNDYYARSLAGFLKARGFTANQIRSGQVGTDVLNEGRAYAIKEAMKATFNDCNQFSDMIASMGYKDPDTASKKIANAMLQGIMPFRRTPANIAVRFKEYSPVEVLNGLGTAARSIVKGDVSAASALDQIASGLTGTAAMAFGWMLANGIGGWKLTGSGTDEDEKRQGHQDYALEFSVDGQEYSYKIDWAAPANMPLFVGANICQMLKDRGGETDMSVFTSILHGMYNSFEPMLALSCLSSVNDFAEGLRYARDGEELYTAVANLATSYFTQGIPALARQAYQATQEHKQTTFANDADPTIRDLQKTAANIPFVGAAFQTDKVNAWGEKENQGNWIERTFNAFLNPGTIKAIDSSAVEQEINRLKDAQPDSVTPDTAAKTLSYTDRQGNVHKNVRLTEEQYQTLARIQGETAKNILGEVTGTDAYKAMTDQQKADLFRQVYGYAREAGRTAAIEDYDGMEDWMKDITPENAVQTFISKSVEDSMNGAFSDIVDDWNRGTDTAQSLKALDQAYRNYQAMDADAHNAFYEDASGRVRYFLDAKKEGMDTKTFTDLYRQYRDIDAKKLSTTDKAQEWAHALEKAADAGTITERQKNNLKGNMAFRYSLQAETKKFDEMIDAGIETDKADAIVHLLDGITGTGAWDIDAKKYAVRDIDKREAIARATGLSVQEIDTVMKCYMEDYDPKDESPSYTEVKYDYIRQGMGLSAAEYAETYRAYLDNAKKAEKIAAIRAMGYDEKTAEALYDVYSGNSRGKAAYMGYYNGK